MDKPITFEMHEMIEVLSASELATFTEMVDRVNARKAERTAERVWYDDLNDTSRPFSRERLAAWLAPGVVPGRIRLRGDHE